MSTLKSIGAVVAGFAAVAGLSTLTDFLLETVGIFPSTSEGGQLVTWMLLLALAYRMIFTVFGGYVTAYLAPRNPMRHVWVLAVIGQIGGVAGVVVGWNLSAHWYPVAIAVTAIPLVWLGGRIYLMRPAVPIGEPAVIL